MTRIEEARQFAHEAHDSINQRRKYTGEPYWVHTDEVADITARVCSLPRDEDAVIAAHFHDVIEDVTILNPKFDIYFISEHFGNRVVGFVTELTDVYTKEAWPDLNRAKRKALERERISRISPEGKTIKLADLISNTKSIVAEDPDFARVYLHEKMALLPYLSNGSPILLQEASELAIKGYQTLGLTIRMLRP